MTLPDPQFWRGRRVLVTGHSGFMGGWLALWLARMGATVTGYGLAPAYDGGIHSVSGLDGLITPVTADIRHASVLRECLHLMRPEIVIHLAAQTSAAQARFDPAETYDVNVMGTVKLLEELRRCRSVRAAVIATGDAVYDNDNAGFAFGESGRLGGHDAASASKTAAEFAAAAFRAPRIAVATVRTGPVIGGGDWNEGRLVADAMRAFAAEQPLRLRAPESIRSWQYVLDALAGYLLVAERLHAGDLEAASPWNLGAGEDGCLPVSAVAEQLAAVWNEDAWPATASWEPVPEPDEARVLKLDTGKAQASLGWEPRVSVDAALAATVAWYKAQSRGDDMAAFSAEAIDSYCALAP